MTSTFGLLHENNGAFRSKIEKGFFFFAENGWDIEFGPPKRGDGKGSVSVGEGGIICFHSEFLLTNICGSMLFECFSQMVAPILFNARIALNAFWKIQQTNNTSFCSSKLF